MARKRPPGLPPGPPNAGDVHRLKIALAGWVPQIWRRIEVPDCTLDLLHVVIQLAMPWNSSHMWCFTVGRTRYIDPEFIDDTDDRPATDTRLSDLAAGKKKFGYEYDFGDSWEHVVTVEKVGPREAGVKYPRCTAGANACPPDDCGGLPGYERMLDILSHPDHEEHADMLEWVGGPFDPTAFDPGAVNRELGKLKL